MKNCLQILAGIFITVSASSQSLTINSNTKLIMRGNVSLVVRNAALINNGTLQDSSGTIQFSGDKDTLFSYLGGTAATSVYNLAINKTGFGTALKSAVAVQNVLGVYNGILYPDSNLTLRSDKDLTARVDVIPAGANIIGKSIVERYFPGRRAWRLVTSPLTSGQSIFDSWQNKAVYTPGINTAITGPNPTGSSGNGLDASPQNNASMKTWNYFSQLLEPVLNTKAKLSPGNNGSADNAGYFLFVRGDRDYNNFYLPNSNHTTLSSNGQLQTGTQTFAASAVAGGFTLIGNPFASPVNFNGVTRTNLIKRFYVWDPSLNIVGAYVMLDDLDNDGNFTKSINASSQNNHLQSGQAFFVETQATGGANITFPEPCKSAVNNNNLFRPQAPLSGDLPLQSIRVVLNLKAADGSLTVADAVLLEAADHFSDSVDRNDALKFGNINETMALSRSAVALAAERRQRLTVKDTLFLKLNKTTQRKYQFEIEPAEINNPVLTAWLEDSYLNTSTPIDLYNNTMIEFDVDANTASSVATRFRIVFKQAAVLPVTFVDIHAQLQNKTVEVAWTVADEINIREYEVERSTDGIHFVSIAIQTAAGKNQYSITDEEPFAGINYYRVKYIELNDVSGYSKIVKVKIAAEGIQPSISIFPNPVENNQINLYFKNTATGKYQVKLMTESGQLIYETTLVYSNSTGVNTVVPTVHLAAATYFIKITDEANNTVTKKIVVQK